jgi:membrane-associated protein
MYGILQEGAGLFFQTDIYLEGIINNYGLLSYAILFLVVFAVTGLVFTPFLPGDSLLFAVGAIAALGSLDIWFVVVSLFIAATLGDTFNYWLGYFLGKRLINNPAIPVSKRYAVQTQEYFKKHGAKTIILARYVPVIRTFAPFVAGIGKMKYSLFVIYSAFGGAGWILIFTLTGYFFGNIPVVRGNFTFVILAIIALSLLPLVYHYWNERK